MAAPAIPAVPLKPGGRFAALSRRKAAPTWTVSAGQIVPAPAGALAVLRILGIRFGIALMHLAQLFFGQWQFFCRIAQQHQPADDRAEGYDEYQPGIPGHCRSPLLVMGSACTNVEQLPVPLVQL
ncbi:protein of unknown function [Pseudomonas sp. JV551A1]|uniref:Uncharacterized protein n=1 Tax=Pseudomonas inefficax TaxID=2078786 RepID=A0AAQ1STF5_9PSED|nr:protein of unknown function [Pseudomonas sp. JV551A1]SPO60204.1 protein of unknown function [Pseudomonas inefficax]